MKNKGRKLHGTTGEVSQRTARELRKELGYARWEKFSKIIEKAMKMCRDEGQEVADHFPRVGKMVGIGSNTQRMVLDYELTPYGCSLIARCADHRRARGIGTLVRRVPRGTYPYDFGQTSSTHYR